jgi:ABC-2 type transport system ATP-binding protein
MTENSTLVHTHGLVKRYGREITAVDGLDLEIREGEVYGFLGPNGAGKTTTLRMLVGLIAPTAGDVRVLGRRPGSAAASAGVGALIEGPAFYPYLSGRDNLASLARICRVGSERVHAVLELVSLTERARTRFSRYSLGMKQRLGVAAALLKEPRLLILDEPTNGLDPAGMRDMRLIIARLKESGYTVLLSSHILGEVQEVCDRVGIINHGRLIAEGTVADLRGRADLRVTATPLDEARRCVERLVAPGRVRLEGDVLCIPLDEIDASVLTRALIDAQVDVVSIERAERSLEDIFFELTAVDTPGPLASINEKEK